jgi:hypothetical protein
MPDIPNDDRQTTHLGWQLGDSDNQGDHYQLVITGSFGQPQGNDNSAVISFENPTEGLEQPSDASN